MIKNYFKIAIRNLFKHKVYSFINIFGLALGMGVTIMISLWIMDEFNYNSYFTNADKMAIVQQHQTWNGQTGTSPAIPLPLEFEMREKAGDKFEHIVMSSWNQPQFFKFQNKTIPIFGSYMQSGVVEMLDLNIIAGDRNGLKQLNSIMLSEASAQTIFGDVNPIGKTIRQDNSPDLNVTAVYESIPVNNDLNDLNFIMPWKRYLSTNQSAKNSQDNWGNNSFLMLVQLADNVDIATANESIRDLKKNANESTKDFNPQIFLQSSKDFYLRADFENGVNVGGRIENVWLFGIIGLFVLILACINFMNLSTARSEKRLLEVGIRKSIGSTRGQLIYQFLSESFLVTLFAAVIAVILVWLSLDSFNDLASKSIEFPWTNAAFWGSILGFTVLVSILAGSYPALYLSSFSPVKVLKGSFKVGRFAALPRKILVVTQFSVSVALIIGTMVVMNQIEYSKDRPSGYDKSGLIQIPAFSGDYYGKQDLIRNQLLDSNAVTDVATSGSPTTEVWSNKSGFDWDGKPEGFQEDIAYTDISYDYATTLNLKFVEGRNFSRDFASDSLGVILNATAVKYMSLTDPVGKFIYNSTERSPETALKIVGVVEDVIIQSPYEPVKQQMYVFDADDRFAYFLLRLDPNQPVSNSLATIENVFKESFPDIPFEYDFVDQEYAAKFASEERVASLARVFSILAIIISCLGLFGLASFVAEQRTKEIGVRKVLGATITNIWVLLSKDFLILVLISLAIATPIAYYFMGEWIQKFSYRTDLSINIFLIAAIGAIVITLLTVSFQAIKAAVSNPIKSLKTE